MSKRLSNYEKGLKGQRIAEDFLLEKGYEIIQRNYRIRSGEIDLIVRDGGYVAFVEVKFRRGVEFGLPAEAVGSAKQKKIKRTALHYIVTNRLDNLDFRFDIVEVAEKAGEIIVNHIENAFL